MGWLSIVWLNDNLVLLIKSCMQFNKKQPHKINRSYSLRIAKKL